MRCCQIVAAFIFVISFNANAIAAQKTKGLWKCNKSRIKISQRFYTEPKLTSAFEGEARDIIFLNDNKAYLTNRSASSYEEQGLLTPSNAEATDAFGNKLYLSRTGDVLGYINKTNSVYGVSPNIKNAKFVLAFDRRAIIVIDPRNGTVYLFNSHKKAIVQNHVHLKSLPQMGDSIASIAIHPLDGRMLLLRYLGGRSYVYNLDKLSVDPCRLKGINGVTEFKDKWMTVLDAILLTHRSNTVYENYCSGSDPQCKDIKSLKSYIDSKFSQLLYTNKKIVANLKNENEKLKMQINNITSLRDRRPEVNNVRDISQLTQTIMEKDQTIKDAGERLGALVSGSNDILSIFNTNVFGSTITANKIDEFSRRNYECILKSDMAQFKQNMTAAETQIEYLFSGMDITKQMLDNTTEMNQMSATNLAQIESIFGPYIEANDYDDIDESELAVSKDNPYEILEAIDVRFGGND